MLFDVLNPLRKEIRCNSHMAEEQMVEQLLQNNPLQPAARERVESMALGLVEQCRTSPENQGLLDAFLQEYSLSTQEGVALMCLAEALLRVPDGLTADRLIAEKIHSGHWYSHIGKSSNLFVNAATWGLMLTGRVVGMDAGITENPAKWLRALVSRLGEPAVRFGVLQAMKLLGQQYVLGRNIVEAIKRGAKENPTGTRFSFDMLGEGARTFEDAKKYFDAYMLAIREIGQRNDADNVYAANGISVKLTALHPRYEFSHQESVLEELVPLVARLAREAKKFNIGFTIDAEEAARLDIGLDVFQALAVDPALEDWDGLGFVLQAYQKRALSVIDWLVALARVSNRRLMVRLVKGAYWDAEIKHAQELGLVDYPVFTRKSHTDLSYQVCAGRLLAEKDTIFPQFATHNAYTVASIIELAGVGGDYEFQRLHGMGDLLYGQLGPVQDRQPPLRVYAPVGSHSDLLPYLVRRLLENGANCSFVNQFLNADVSAASIIGNVEATIHALPGSRHTGIPVPRDIFTAFGELRKSARGIDLDDALAADKLCQAAGETRRFGWRAGPVINGQMCTGKLQPLSCPADTSITVGQYTNATDQDVANALTSADMAQPSWQALGPDARAVILERAADLMEERMALLTGLISYEAGRTLDDSVSEVREAVDFCRYYALQIRRITDQPPDSSSLAQGRGVFVCISPWNFPLAIFVGQVVAALAAGNTVIAKPAEQTPMVAVQAVLIIQEAGVPGDVLHLLIGPGWYLGPLLMADRRVAGVAFTGSTETARRIQDDLVTRGGTLPPLIAETGGQNTMLVDSTALPEQVVDDVVQSAFLSAGQRCSALRVLLIQEEVAESVISMLRGALETLTVGEPWRLSSDIGPVIDKKALQMLRCHIDRMHAEAIFVGSAVIPEGCPEGNYIEPHIFEINSISQLEGEVFGPILHVMRYRACDLDNVLTQINETGFGLTLGIHSRINSFADTVFSKTRVGNTYINRNMVGAVVGVNPFGGQGLSGTGYKAGGPHYLLRFTNLWRSPPIGGVAVKAEPLTAESRSALLLAQKAQWHWNGLTGEQRATKLNNVLTISGVSDLTIPSVLLRCGALLEEASAMFTETTLLPGPTGERNELSLHGRGVFLICASENSFSYAVQHTIAALAAGNAVLLVAETTEDAACVEVIATWVHRFLPEALVAAITTPSQFIALAGQSDIAGIVTKNTHGIAAILAARAGPIIPLLTEPVSDGVQSLALLPYAVEKTKTNNIVATGGNALLLNLTETIA
ncbi:bifunctional proline dehydrogenase/L-glutamate gamma-semialdehyde dehydrogenase PutA [Exilibacterium tricleocarpae]|uniref:Bifunctional protein PutA n=2 Tax=Exilibacterium tricleocarpae TaxID=2591008 RepID=A0A545SYE3_9GAMM|nr:bifunctional proline dehydrogenase/L-glutamate gamma-semialdehyde dehydrogenase PutA [Exilibacterium tricleocarpae]